MNVEIDEALPSGGGWTRQRIVLLSVSSALLLGLLIAVSEVLLPFVLAIIIAYVLLPLVTLGERRLKLPRSLSIVLVYVFLLSSLYVLLAAVAPRLLVEAAHFARDAPSMLRGAAKTYGPHIDERVNDYLHQSPVERSHAAGGSQPKHLVEASPDARASGGELDANSVATDVPLPPVEGALEGARVDEDPSAQSAKQDTQAAFVIRPRADGSYAVELGSGLDVRREGQDHYRIAKREHLSRGRFRVTELLADGVEKFVSYVERNAAEFVKLGQTIVARAARGIFMTFMVLMVAGYLMQTHESVLGFFRSLAPPLHRQSFARLLSRMDRGLAGVVRGQLIICVVNGLLSALGFWLLDLKYWPILALVAAAMSIIPIFGAILSTVPAVLIALTQDLWTAIWVTVWIVGIHQVEANLLNPKIIGAAAKIHPVPVVFSLVVGEHFFGIWGAILAVPVLSLTQSVFTHFRLALPDAPPDSLPPLAPPGSRGL